jgi:TRAP-type C4-dicarboxylate transport system substrate-binding protein
MRHALLVCALAAGACGPATGDAEVWRFAIEESPGSVQDAYAQRFRERIEAETGGAVRVVVYPYGALGTSDHIAQQLHNGTLELAMASPGHLGTLIPEVQAFLLHFVLSSDAGINARALLDPELRAFLDDLYAEKGLAFLTAFGEGDMVWTTRRPVHTPEDLRGVRFRTMTSPLLLASYAAYGASPTPLPYGEVYSGLQLRMIDAQVNPLFAIEEMSFYEVTDYLVFPHHAEFVTTLAADPAWLGRLPPERRRLLRETVDELQNAIFEVQRRSNLERLERIRARRPEMREIELGDEERAAFEARATAVRERFEAEVGPRGARLLELLDAAIARASSPPTSRD